MYQKIQNIKNLQANDIVNDIFVIKAKRGVQSYANDTKFRFELRLGDATGETNLKFWGGESEEEVKEIYDNIQQDDIIFLQGKVIEFNEMLDISANIGIHEIKKLVPTEYDPSIFIKKSEKNIELLFSELLTIVNEVNNQELKNILNTFFQDQDFVKKYKLWPAANYRHHAYIGGLLEHSLAVTKICLSIAKTYPELDKDLLITGATLHDIGKIQSLQLSNSIKLSDKGLMKNSLVLGLEELSKKTKTIIISPNLKLKLENIMLSNLGKKEYGSPVLPTTPEALVISIAKNLDSKTQAMLEVKKEADHGEDTIYHKDFGTIFLK
jgi:3'-5' exoribonuclease